MSRRVVIIGAGWAGLSAAIHASRAGHSVRVFEMADRPGGRARTDRTAAGLLDNGPHILIGAYAQTLELLQWVGVDVGTAFERTPLYLVDPAGRGLQLSNGTPSVAFARAVLSHPGWGLTDRVALLRHAGRWRLHGFTCAPLQTVADLCRHLPVAIRRELIDPLCVAALNTDPGTASAAVWLTVLRDALFKGRGGSDLMLPRVPLQSLLPDAGHAWLRSRGVEFTWHHRVQGIARQARQWLVDGVECDAVVLATPAREAARLVRDENPQWSATAQAMQHEPILTTWLRDTELRWPRPMLAFNGNPGHPAQFGFDLGALGQHSGTFAFVASAAGPLVAKGLDGAAAQMLEQARQTFPGAFVGQDAILHVAAERRATFVCSPGLARPPSSIAAGLAAAGDYVQGPYPSTLEGAVRSGRVAVTEALAPSTGSD